MVSGIRGAVLGLGQSKSDTSSCSRDQHRLHNSLEGSQGSAVAHTVWFTAVSSQSGTKEGEGAWPSPEETGRAHASRCPLELESPEVCLILPTMMYDNTHEVLPTRDHLSLDVQVVPGDQSCGHRCLHG